MTRTVDEELDARDDAMRTIVAALIVSLVDLWPVSMAGGQQPAASPSVTTSSERPWWNGGIPRRPSENPDARKLALIRVEGNKFVDPQGRTVVFRGVSISDPDKLERQGHWNKAHFEHVKELGANLVRIPVHPAACASGHRPSTWNCSIKQSRGALSWICTSLSIGIPSAT